MNTFKERLLEQQAEPVKFPGLRVSTARIHLDPRNDQIYGTWDPDQNTKDKELLESIRELGLLQAITVRTHPTLPDEYIVLSGHRRYAACKALGKKRIECMVMSIPANEEELTRVDMGLVQTNSTVRDRTPGMIAKEIEYFENKLKELIKTNPDSFAVYGTHMREAVAKAAGVSEHAVANANIIRNNVDPETYAAYKADAITQKEAMAVAEKKIIEKKEKKKTSAVITLVVPDPAANVPPVAIESPKRSEDDLDYFRSVLTKKLEDTLARLSDNVELFMDDDIRDLITKLSAKVRIKVGLKEVEE